MTENSFKGITNVTTEGREQSSLNNRVSSQSALDKIASHFSYLKAQSQKIEKDEFYGYLLWAHLISVEKFEQIYDSSSSFYKEIMNAAGNINPKSSGSIVQYRIHVPEITGMLPFPDMTNFFKSEIVLDEAIFLDEEAQNAADKKKADEGFKKVKQLNKAFFQEMLKLDLFPRMYRYTETAGGTVSSFPGQFCKVKISKSFPTMGVGIVLEVFDETIDVTGFKELD